MVSGEEESRVRITGELRAYLGRIVGRSMVILEFLVCLDLCLMCNGSKYLSL